MKSLLRSTLVLLIFILVQQDTYLITQRRARSPETVRTNGSSGIVEGLNIGLIGFGVGILVYNQILHKKLSIENQKKYIVKKLKSF